MDLGEGRSLLVQISSRREEMGLGTRDNG